MTIKDWKYVKVYNVNPVYLIFNKVNGYIEEINENKFLTLVPTNENKEKIKKYEKLWRKVRYLIRLTTQKSYDYDVNIPKSNLI